ncbi:MAG: beta-lactamase family protein [Saprospiraceae bacterium]|nr:beta-lactamase family protein [Saprospiraceae bacterium]
MRNMLRKYILIPLCLLLGNAFPLAGQISTEQLASIDRLLSGREDLNPGFAIGITHENRLIYEKTFGVGNLHDKVKISTETRFPVASMGKQFIATAIGLLVLDGKLSLEDELSTHLPELDGYTQGVRIKHLIHHTSGMKDYVNLMVFRGDEVKGLIPLDKGIHLLSRLRALNFEPGDQFSYSNSNYLLLSEIVSRVSKMDFRDFITERIFHPLDMNNTGFLEPTSGQDQVLALDYRKEAGGRYVRSDQVIAAQDQIFSTIKDLSLWDENFYSQVLGGKTLQDMLLQRGRLSNREEINYAFGLFINDYKGLRTISHAGDMGGYHSQFLQFPEEQMSIIVLTNAADFNAYGTSYQIADILFEGKLASEEGVENLPVIKVPKKKLKLYTGAYWNESINRPRIVYVQGGSLRYNRPDNFESRLVPVGEHQFRIVNAQQKQSSTVEFVMIGDKVKELIFRPVQGQESSMKLYEYPAYSTKELDDFAGTYYSKELGTAYQLSPNKTKLNIHLKGKEISKMVAIKADYFKDGYFGDFRFVRNNDRELEGFYLSTKSKRATNMYFEKQK